MSRTSTTKPVKEIIREFLQGRGVRTSKGQTQFISRDTAEIWASELAELLPRSTGAKAWVGYALDRSTILFNGASKAEVKEKWQTDIHAGPKEVRTVYSGTGIYRYSFTAPDFSTYDIWIVPVGTEGFGNAS